MRNILTAVIIVLSFGMFSCQKEVDDIFATNGNSGENGTLLTKITSKSGSDSAALSFFYNSSKKLIGFTSDIISGGMTVSVSERAQRNSVGIIQSVVYKSDQYQQLGLDSVVSVIKYSAGRYTAEVTQFDLGGIIMTDSVALIYDGSGKVIREESYMDLLGSTELTGKTEYTYNGNNLATINNYSYDASSSQFSLQETYTYDQYDDKTNPMYFGFDAFVFGSPAFYSVNNPLKSSQAGGGATSNYTTTYTYNASKKPVTAISVVQPSNITSTGNYYYQ